MVKKSAQSSVQTSESVSPTVVKVPPDGKWGWMVVIAYAVTNVIVIPVLQTFGLIYKDVLEDMSISATDASIIVNSFSAFGMSLGLINGPLLRNYGYRKVGLASGIFFSIGIMLTSGARSFTYFMVTYSTIAAAGFGMATSAFSLALNTYFRKRRNRAVGIATTLTGLGPIFMPQLISVLLEKYGPHGCMLVIGALSLHIIMAALLLQPIKWHLVEEEQPEAVKEAIEVEMQVITKSIPEENEESDSKDEKDDEISIPPNLPIEHIYNFEFSSDEDEDDYLDMADRRLSIVHDVDMQSIYGFEVTQPLMHQNSISNFRSRQDLSFNRQHSLDFASSNRNIYRLRRMSSANAATAPKKRWFDVSRETVNLGSSINIFTEQRPERILKDHHKSIQFPAAALKVVEEENKIVEKSRKLSTAPSKTVVTFSEEHKVKKKKSFKYHLRKFGRRTVKFFDFGLLKDPIYVNMMLGMSIAVFAEINFSLLTPFILADMNYSTEEIASVMSALAITDIIFRFLAPYLGELLKQTPRIMYMISLILLIFTRSLVFSATTYSAMLVVGLLLGVAKGVRTVYMSLVIPDYIPIERLASASGIQMVTNGVILIALGPLLGWIRDVSGSYQKCILIINLVTLTTILMWTAELLYFRFKKKT